MRTATAILVVGGIALIAFGKDAAGWTLLIISCLESAIYTLKNS